MAENCLKSVPEEGDVMDEVATGEDRPLTDSGTEYPVIETSEMFLSDLSEEDQLEIDVSSLGADFQQGTATITSGPASQEAQQYGLQDQPDDPAYIQVLQPSSPSLSAPPLPADLLDLAELGAETAEAVNDKENLSTDIPADMDDCGVTIIPSIPIEKDDTDWEKTKEYPVATQLIIEHIEEFNASRWRQKYEDALIEHVEAIRMQVKGVTPNSVWLKPPSFKEFFDRFIAELSKDEHSGQE